MKKSLCLAAALAAVGILSRLPHPAQDIAKLDPVRVVHIDLEEGLLRLKTDTGAQGSGLTLSAAEADLRSRASGEIYLDTAEFLILHPDVPVTDAFFDLLSPSCRVCTVRQLRII